MNTEQMNKEIGEMNRVIAEWMGLKDGDFYRHQNAWYIACKGQNLQYHSDWNWLMEVVEKIEAMDYGFKMCRKVVEVYIDSTKETIIKVKESSRIESTFNAVYKFIQWHNDLNTPKNIKDKRFVKSRYPDAHEKQYSLNSMMIWCPTLNRRVSAFFPTFDEAWASAVEWIEHKTKKPNPQGEKQ